MGEETNNMQLQIPPNYGYCVLTVASTIILNIICTIFVVKARKKYGIKFPDLYAPHGHKYKKSFDSAQRQHQQFLEGVHFFNMCVLINGLMFPAFSACCGVFYFIGRVAYSYGYAQFGPQYRQIGGIIAHLGDIPMYVCLFYTGYLLI